MDTVLKTVVSLNIGPGAVSPATAHGLMQRGTSVVPDVILLNQPGCTATATSTTITVTNNGDLAVAPVLAICEHWHSIERAMLEDPLTPQPFVVTPGLAGSAGMPDPFTPPTGTWNVTGSVAVSAGVTIDGRDLRRQGADVVAAAALGLNVTPGNTYSITAGAPINIDQISNVGWRNGTVVTLVFADGNSTVRHGQATAGTNITILLAGGANQLFTLSQTLTLILGEIGGVQAWRELSRGMI